VCALIALDRVKLTVPSDQVRGIVAVALAGLVADLTKRWWIGAVLSIPGSLIIAATPHGLRLNEHSHHAWLPFAVVLAVAVGGGCASAIDMKWRYVLVPVLLLLAIGGVYGTTPDTEFVRTILGAVLPFALLGWPLGLARASSCGTFACAGLFAWATIVDGAPRPGSIVGGLLCVAALAVPFVIAAVARVPQLRSHVEVVFVLMFEVVVVAWMSRAAGLHASATDAFVIGMFGVVAVPIVGFLFGLVARALGHDTREPEVGDSPSMSTDPR
jgi:hypothetical protein